MLFVKRHLSIILIVLLTLLAIAFVLWVFDKRLQRLNTRVKITTSLSYGFTKAHGDGLNMKLSEGKSTTLICEIPAQ